MVTHGNGPQVGNLLVKNELAAAVVPPVPLDWCGAQTQATLGFVLMDALDAELARRGVDRRSAALVTRALVIEDRRDEWTRVGTLICQAAPEAPGVYVLYDASGTVLYVGKANNLRRRLRAHFTPGRWRGLNADLARIANAEWCAVGSELEALLIEAKWIDDLAPKANVQTGPPSLEGRNIPPALLHDVLIVLPASQADFVTFVAARVTGSILIQRTRRDGQELAVHAPRLWRFFKGRSTSQPQRRKTRMLSPLVFSWLDGRGASATRLDVEDLLSVQDLQDRLASALAHRELFAERLVVRRSVSRRSCR